MTAASHILLSDPFKASGNSTLPFDADLNPYLSPVTISGFQAGKVLTDGFTLMGPSSFAPLASLAAGGSLDFPTTDPRFFQVNSYYHLHKTTHLLNGAHIMPLGFSAVRMDAQCVISGNSVNNAFFDPRARMICLGYAPLQDGTKVWAATDPDVIVHEFGHSLTHTYSTDAIIGAHLEGLTIDEGLADFWAYLMNGNAGIGGWYGAGIMRSLFPGALISGPNPLRTLTLPRHYPDQLAGEGHTDSTVISSVLYEMSQIPPLTDQLNMATFLKDIILSFQGQASIGDFARGLIDEADSIGLGDTARAILSAHGLLRKDHPSDLAISASDVLIVDSHQLDSVGYQGNGNCNGQLDQNERAVVLINLHDVSTQSDFGAIEAVLSTTAPASQISIVTGGSTGTYARVLKGKSSIQSIPVPHDLVINAGGSVTRYGGYLLSTAFVVQAGSTASGTYQLNLRLRGMNTVDDQPQVLDLPIQISVGSNPNYSYCSANLWP